MKSNETYRKVSLILDFIMFVMSGSDFLVFSVQ